MNSPINNRPSVRAFVSDSALPRVSDASRSSQPEPISLDGIEKGAILDFLIKKKREIDEASSSSESSSTLNSRVTTPRRGHHDQRNLREFHKDMYRAITRIQPGFHYYRFSSWDELVDNLNPEECFSLIQCVKNFWAIRVRIPQTLPLVPNHPYFKPTQMYLLDNRSLYDNLKVMNASEIEDLGTSLSNRWAKLLRVNPELADSGYETKFFTKSLDEK